MTDDDTAPDGFAPVAAALDGVEGWLTLAQARDLWAAARALVPGQRVVEIGSFRGRSTAALALGALDGVEVVAIDPHAGNDRGPNELTGYEQQAAADHEAFHATLERAGVADRVRHVRLPSQQAGGVVPGPVHLLFVDGAHRPGPARHDLAQWGARLTPGATLFVHDAFSSAGVTLALLATLTPSPRYRYAGRTGSLAAYRVGGDPSDRSGKGGDVARQLAQLGWLARNLAVKALVASGVARAARWFGRPVPTWPY